MNDEQNFSTIASSYTPSDYSKSRYAADAADADLPLPTTDVFFDDDALKE